MIASRSDALSALLASQQSIAAVKIILYFCYGPSQSMLCLARNLLITEQERGMTCPGQNYLQLVQSRGF
nr:hypothetical protein CFP56_12372 [Quercus suber]